MNSPSMSSSSAPTQRIRVMLVDDERIGRTRLRMLLEREADIEIVAEAIVGILRQSLLGTILADARACVRRDRVGIGHHAGGVLFDEAMASGSEPADPVLDAVDVGLG